LRLIDKRLGGTDIGKTFFKIHSDFTSSEMETRFIFFDNSGVFGEYLFYKHNLIFIFSGLLLFFAMVVSIVICMAFSDKRNVNPHN
jgi:hypothetical protein